MESNKVWQHTVLVNFSVNYSGTIILCFQYLEKNVNLPKKLEICGDILEFLPQQLPLVSKDKVSYQILEVILYQVSLLVQSQKPDAAAKALQVRFSLLPNAVKRVRTYKKSTKLITQDW